MEAIAAAAATGICYSVVYPWFYQRPWGQNGCMVMPHGSLLCGADCGWEAQGEEEVLGTDPDMIEGEIEHQERKARADRMVQEAHRERSALPSGTTTSRARDYTQHHGNLDEVVGGSGNRQRFSTNLDDVVVPLPRAAPTEETEQVDRISRFVGSAKQYARAVPMKVHLPHQLPLPHPSRIGRPKSAQDGKPVTVDTVQDGPPLRV